MYMLAMQFAGVIRHVRYRTRGERGYAENGSGYGAPATRRTKMNERTEAGTVSEKAMAVRQRRKKMGPKCHYC